MLLDRRRARLPPIADGAHSSPKMYPLSQQRLTDQELDRMLVWSSEQGASDIKFQTNHPARIEVHKKLRRITPHELDQADIELIIRRLFNANAIALMASDGGQSLDRRYQVKTGRDTILRFRCNVIPVIGGYQITLRTLPDRIQTFGDLGTHHEIIDNWYHPAGIIVVTGPTGSGKSTLLAAGIHHMVHVLDVGHIVTGEAPVEFPLQTLSTDSSFVSQTEIGTQIATFAAKNAADMRRHPAALVTGEMRNLAEIEAAIQGAQSGHPMYATAHTVGVGDTIARMINVFPLGQRDQISYDLVDMMRLVVSQILVPHASGQGLVPLLEWLVFDQALRERLLREVERHLWSTELREIVATRGRSIEISAEQAYRSGRITEQQYHRIARR
jgi:Tfp pilus assembly pilus retraction ATPase PilT